MDFFRTCLADFIRPVLLSSALMASCSSVAQAEDHSRGHELNAKPFASLLQVKGKPTPPPAGVEELKFREFFKLPIGPQGLEPTEKLLKLNGQRVRIFGYMVNAEDPSPGPFILAPLVVSMAEKEDGPADDMPATTLFVHIEHADKFVVPYVPGLLKLTGTLDLGNQEEPDGRVSAVRLKLDPDLSRKLLARNAIP